MWWMFGLGVLAGIVSMLTVLAVAVERVNQAWDAIQEREE